MIVILLAAILDYAIGDPWGWIHPVQIIGWFIGSFSRWGIECTGRKWLRKILGAILGLMVVVGSGGIAWLVVDTARRINYWLGLAIATILLASCLAGRSLRAAALDVLQPLHSGDIQQARSRLRSYVGRDTAHLSEPEVLRAVLETVAENATDGVTAPLFYAILGATFSPLGSAPVAIAYKALSTLDSMIGYQREPLTDIGWFSAKLEDCATWLPCRLMVLTLALISGKPKRVFEIVRRDGVRDSSPNSGWSEGAYAAILGVQLGGINYYQGQLKVKPFLGEPLNPITPETIESSLNLTRSCFLLHLLVASAIFWGKGLMSK